MKTKLLLIAACCLSLTGLTFPQSRTWEYKFLYQCDEKKTNSLASDGWELAEMSTASYGSIGVATCVFKRPKP